MGKEIEPPPHSDITLPESHPLFQITVMFRMEKNRDRRKQVKIMNKFRPKAFGQFSGYEYGNLHGHIFSDTPR